VDEDDFSKTSLAMALGKPIPERARASYWNQAENFDAVITSVRGRLSGFPSDASDFMFTAAYSLLLELAVNESVFRTPCDRERSMVTELFELSAGTIPYFISPQFFATRILSRLSYGQAELPAPSLDFGIGDGVSARYVFGDRRITAGADLFIHDLVAAAKLNGCEGYFACDIMNAPFPDGAFNTAFCLNTVYHASSKELALREMARLVGAGGTLHFDDITSAYMTERPLARMLETIGFDAASQRVQHSQTRRQTLYSADEYRRTLSLLGFDRIEVAPTMSIPLFRLVYFFYDLHRLFGSGGAVGASHLQAYRALLLEVFAPLLAADRTLSHEHGSAFLTIHATKSGQMRDGAVQLRCPVCHGPLRLEANAYLSDCGVSFPVVHGIPLLTREYPAHYAALTR
jgi:SAM-dependent methyltransferase